MRYAGITGTIAPSDRTAADSAVEELRHLEDEHYNKINQTIAHRITPIYNAFLLFFAGVFCYFVVMEENKCYAKA